MGSCNLTDTELQSRTGWWGVIEASGGCEDTKGLSRCGNVAGWHKFLSPVTLSLRLRAVLASSRSA